MYKISDCAKIIGDQITQLASRSCIKCNKKHDIYYEIKKTDTLSTTRADDSSNIDNCKSINSTEQKRSTSREELSTSKAAETNKSISLAGANHDQLQFVLLSKSIIKLKANNEREIEC